MTGLMARLGKVEVDVALGWWWYFQNGGRRPSSSLQFGDFRGGWGGNGDANGDAGEGGGEGEEGYGEEEVDELGMHG